MNIHGKGSWRFQAFDGCLALWTNTPPHWFHRWAQRIMFGFRWDKPE
jgi:hypothetical protein